MTGRFRWLSLTLVALAASPALAQTPPYNGEIIIGSAAEPGELTSAGPAEPLLVAIDTPYQVFDQAGSLLHIAAWDLDGRPAGNAEVYLGSHRVGRTDERGTFVVRWGVHGSTPGEYWFNGSAVMVVWERDGVRHEGEVWFNAMARTQSFTSDHLYVYTDRGLYNPGQTIHLRTLAWNLERDWAAVPNAEVEVLLTSPEGQGVAGTRLTTNELGTAWTDLPLSAQAAEGLYTLTVSYGDASAETRLRVERFVAPQIRIDHTIGRFLTRDQDALAFEVTLGTFTGTDFEAGTVAFDLLVDGSSRHHETREVTGPGPHPFAIEGGALDDIRDGLNDGQPIQVQLAVEDAHGRRDELRRDLTFTANPYVAVIEKDRDFYNTGDPVELIVRLTDIERVPVRDTAVVLRTSRNERLEGQTDAAGMVQFSLTMGGEGFNADVYLADVETPLATAWIDWLETAPMRSHIAEAIVAENAPTTIRVSFPSHFEPAEAVVHMDVIDSSGSLVNAVLIPIRREGETYIAETDFTAPSWGSMLLTLFCLGRDTSAAPSDGPAMTSLGLLTEGQNLAVQPNRELRIHLDGIPEQVEPGAELSGQVRVTDPLGNPVDAALGVAVVDQSVISLKDPLEITPMDHFYNPELRVISTTGSAILTWPVVSRNWGFRQMDIALPPFPFGEAGPVNSTFRGVRTAEPGQPLDPGVMMAEPAPTPEEVTAEEAEDYGVMAQMAAPIMGYGEGMGLMGSGTGGSGVGYGSVTLSEASLDYRGRAAEDVAPAPPVIHIRTEFPETAAWLPDLRAIGGEGSFTAQVPDSITVQEIALIASDGRGGVGVLRQPVSVRQPVWVDVDMPDTLTVGDRVQATVVVHNFGAAPIEARIGLQSQSLEVVGAPRFATIEANAMAVERFEVAASAPGQHDYSVTAWTAEREDSEERQVWVRPAGSPEVAVQDAWMTAASPFLADVMAPPDGQMTTVTLNVAFPAVSAGYAGLDAIQQSLRSGDLMGKGGELLATLWVYQARRSTADPGTLLALRNRIDFALAGILAAQRTDGGWGFWWDAESQPYVSGYCLEALILAKQLDFLVPDLAISNASRFLIDALGEDGLYDVGAIAFWEGDSDAVRLGITAEIFAILAAVPAELRPETWSAAIQRMASPLREYLDHDAPEVMVYAHAVLGLHRLSRDGSVTIDAERLVQAANRLGDLRREGHWEPSWFNAYGGTIEATVAAIEVYQALGQSMPEADMRDAVRYLLSTRDEWGGWHNPRGTAAAIRGLLLLSPPEEAAAATVRVLVDGVEMRTITIDPRDPYLSALELRTLDLTPCVTTGAWVAATTATCRPAAGVAHRVEVYYDGTLNPHVQLVQRHWSDAAVAEGREVAIEAELEPAELAPGEFGRLVVEVRSSTNNSRLVQVDVAAPSNAALDRTSVQGLRDAGLVDAHEWSDGGVRLFLQLEGEASRRLEIGLEARAAGIATVPAVTASVIGAEAENPISAHVAHPLRVGP